MLRTKVMDKARALFGAGSYEQVSEFIQWERNYLTAWFDKQHQEYLLMLDVMAEFEKNKKEFIELREMPRCTGSISGRYAIHKTNESCPIHGQPNEGGRLRASISVQGMEAVEIAISNYKKLKDLGKSALQRQGALNKIRGNIGLKPVVSFYKELPEDLKREL